MTDGSRNRPAAIRRRAGVVERDRQPTSHIKASFPGRLLPVPVYAPERRYFRVRCIRASDRRWSIVGDRPLYFCFGFPPGFRVYAVEQYLGKWHKLMKVCHSVTFCAALERNYRSCHSLDPVAQRGTTKMGRGRVQKRKS